MIAYRANLALSVLKCGNAACTAGNTITFMGDPHRIYDSSIAVPPDGLPVISYYDDEMTALKVAKCGNAACTAGNTITTVDEAGLTGFGPSIAIGTDGLPVIAYWDGTEEALKVAKCGNPACSGPNAITTVDNPGNNVGNYASIAVGSDGLPVITYWDLTDHVLKVAKCGSAACTMDNTITVVDSANAGREMSIAIGHDGYPVISYQDLTGNGLKIAKCGNGACTAGNTITIVDNPAEYAGLTPSLAIGPAGRPVVSYTSVQGENPTILRVARCFDATCRCTPRADFNRDGFSDLLWRHQVSGQNVAWFMNGVDLATGTFTNPSVLADAAWRLVGTSDFNRDGSTDLLWRHATSGENVAWFMNGVDLVAGTFTNPSALGDVNWQMVGTGDFDLDSRPDLLWRHDISGQNVVWFMNGTTLVGGTFTVPAAVVDPNWRVGGTGDFNEDGRPDILWHHRTAGKIFLWYMNGPTMTAGTFTEPAELADVDWRVAAVGDYNSDQRPDIVWRHQGSGQNVVWFMNGRTLVDGAFTNPNTLADLDWKIVGPR